MTKRIYVQPVYVDGQLKWGTFEMTLWQAFVADCAIGLGVAIWNLLHPKGGRGRECHS